MVETTYFYSEFSLQSRSKNRIRFLSRNLLMGIEDHKHILEFLLWCTLLFKMILLASQIHFTLVMNFKILNYKSFNIISSFSFEVYSPFLRSGFLIIRITPLCSNEGDINGFSSVKLKTNLLRGITSQCWRNSNKNKVVTEISFQVVF